MNVENEFDQSENLRTVEGPFPTAQLLEVYNRSDYPKWLRGASELNFTLGKDEIIYKITPDISTSNVEADGSEPEAVEEDEKRVVAEIGTIYNPTADNRGEMAARIEALGNQHSRVAGFREEGGLYVPNLKAPVFENSQDPAWMPNIKKQDIFAVIHTTENRAGEIINWQEVFYTFQGGLENIDVNKPFALGPEKMKDIRLVEWTDGKIGVFTRPQGEVGGRGKVAYIEIDTLSDLTTAIPQAVIIPDVFIDEEWGGVNNIKVLSNTEAGLTMHIARFNPENGEKKDYYPATAIFHRNSCTITEMEIIGRANDLPFKVTPKMPNLGEVMFMGGAAQEADNHISLTMGTGDVAGIGLPPIDPESFNRYMS